MTSDRPEASTTSDQLALDVDPTVALDIVERRNGDERTLRVGPLAEPDARALAALLLNRSHELSDEGPWRCAIAGGVRMVALKRLRSPSARS